MRILLTKISLIIFLAFFLSVGVDYFYRQSYKAKYELPDNLLPFSEITDKYEIVGLGNSHAEAGLTFDKFKTRSLKLASVAQSFEYDLAMLKMHTKQIKNDAIILITVSPLSFSQKIPEKTDNVNMNYYDGRLSPFLIPHLKLAEYLQIQIFPFVRSGYLWREQFAQYSENKAMKTFAKNWEQPAPTVAPVAQEVTPLVPTLTETVTSPEIVITPDVIATRSTNPTFNVYEIQKELNTPPDPLDEKFMESVAFMLNKWTKTDGFDKKYFDKNRKDLEELIAYCVKHNWRPILVTFPISQALQEKLDPTYLDYYLYDQLKKLDLKEIDYVDFIPNTQITQNKYLFDNSDHLNNKGAAITSYLLLQELIKANYLPKKVDGYDYTVK